MKNGQIGTELEKRFIFVWEGTVASLPDVPVIRGQERLRLKLHQWDGAMRLWQPNETTFKWMWSILIRTNCRIDIVVTSRPPRFARAVAARAEEENWPVRYVFASPADTLGRRLPSMPDVERVVYALEEHRWAFGPQGMSLPQTGQVV